MSDNRPIINFKNMLLGASFLAIAIAASASAHAATLTLTAAAPGPLTQIADKTATEPGNVLTLDESTNAKDLDAEIHQALNVGKSIYELVCDGADDSACNAQFTELKKIAKNYEYDVLFVRLPTAYLPMETRRLAAARFGTISFPLHLVQQPSGGLPRIFAGMMEEAEINEFLDSARAELIYEMMTPPVFPETPGPMNRLVLVATPDLYKVLKPGLELVAKQNKENLQVSWLDPRWGGPLVLDAAQATGGKSLYPVYLFFNNNHSAIHHAGMLQPDAVDEFVKAGLAIQPPRPVQAEVPPKERIDI